MITLFIYAMLFIIYVMLTNSPPIPLEAIEINKELVVTEEKITGKNGGHNDGTIYQKYELNDEELKEVITIVESNPHWQKGSLSQELKEELIYMNSIGPNHPMLYMDNGYFFFKDRHEDASGDIYKFDREVVISSRYSCNYMMGALDVENKTLYYFQLDT